MLLPFKKPSFYCLIGRVSQSEKIKTVTGVWLFTQELRNSKKCFEISDFAWELFIKSQVCFSFAPWCSSGFRNTSFPPCNCRGQGTACHATILAHASSRGPSHLHTPQPWRHPDCNTIFLCSLVKNRSEKNILKKRVLKVSQLTAPFFAMTWWCWGLRTSSWGSRDLPNAAYQT